MTRPCFHKDEKLQTCASQQAGNELACPWAPFYYKRKYEGLLEMHKDFRKQYNALKEEIEEKKDELQLPQPKAASKKKKAKKRVR